MNFKIAIVLFGTIFAMGCGPEAGNSDGISPAPTNTSKTIGNCAPGQQNECTCGLDSKGMQTCLVDGTFSVCTCDMGVTCGGHARPGETTLDGCCENGGIGYLVCLAWGKWSDCMGCGQTGADAGTVTCDGQPVGHPIGTNCCPDGSTGYAICQANGEYAGCIGCQAPQADAGNDADAQHQCETDQDCAKFNTECMFFSCLNHECFETHDTCGPDAGNPPTVYASLAADTPAGMNVVKNAANVQMLKINLVANYDAHINRLRFHRVGTGAASDMIKVHLSDQNGNSLSYGHTVDPLTNMVEFESLNITVQSGNVQSYIVTADFAGPSIGITGGQHAFELQDASAVWLSDVGSVQGSFPVRGNTFTVASAQISSLSVGLASTPVSGTLVKKQQLVDVLGIWLTAGTNDLKIMDLPLRCQASINGAAYASSDCWKRITSLSVWDGSTQIGLAKAPETDGSAVLTYMNYVIPNGMTKNLTVKASFTSTASSIAPYDRFSVGLDANMTATDTVYNQNVAALVNTQLVDTQLSPNPITYFTILNSGTLSVKENGHPARDIVVAGKDVWVPFARYSATSQHEAMEIDRISISSLAGGDNADFTQIAIASQGTVKGIGMLPAGEYGNTDIDLTGNPINVPKDGSADLEVWAKIAPTMASSAVNGAWQGVCRSGHAPALGLNNNKQSGEWNAAYAGKINARTTGDTSGERIYADAGAKPGNAMVIRKTKPVVVKQNLANNVLTLGENELFRMQVGANAAGPVALKQFTYAIERSDTVTLSSFRFYRGSMQLPSNQYSVVDGFTGADLKAGALLAGTGTAMVVVAFTEEDVIIGSGNVYSLRATNGYSTPGSYVKTKLYQDPNPAIKTGYLLQNDAYAPFTASYGIFNVGYWGDQNNLGAWHVRGTFVWSDNSEVPHIPQVLPSSGDWMADYLVQDLTSTSILSN